MPLCKNHKVAFIAGKITTALKQNPTHAHRHLKEQN